MTEAARLREKFGAEREQPVSGSLIESISSLAGARGATKPDDSALRTRPRSRGSSAAISDRAYDRIFTRAQAPMPWSQRTPLTAHVLRHTTSASNPQLASAASEREPWLVTLASRLTPAEQGTLTVDVEQLLGDIAGTSRTRPARHRRTRPRAGSRTSGLSFAIDHAYDRAQPDRTLAAVGVDQDALTLTALDDGIGW